MKILMLVSSMHAGGAERVAATLVNAWSERGDTVILTPTYSSKGTCFYPLSDKVQLSWLADLAGTRASGAMAAFKRLLALRKHIRDSRPDVVVSFLTNVNVAAILATRGLNVPLIVCERTNPVAETTTGSVWRKLRRVLYPRADMVTVQAEDTAGPFARQVPGIRRLAVIPNPLPAPLLDAPLVQQRQEAGPRELIAMGRLVPDKQFGLLIDIFAQMRRNSRTGTCASGAKAPSAKRCSSRWRVCACNRASVCLGAPKRLGKNWRAARPSCSVRWSKAFPMCCSKPCRWACPAWRSIAPAVRAR